MATTIEVLTEARRLIADKGWCQGFWSRNAAGKGIWQFPHQVSPDDCAFCADGALIASERTRGHLYNRAVHLLNNVVGHGHSIMAWNDDADRTKEEVLAAFDKAIELAKSEKADV